MAERLRLTDEERRERRREQNRQCYARHAKERIAQVSERRRERKREDPNYVPREERVTPPEVLEARRLKKLARTKLYYEKHRTELNQRGTERNRERRATDDEFAERSREYTRKYREKNLDEVNTKAREMMRVIRATPEGNEANRRQCQKYRTEHRDELLPKQRAKHHANRDENNVRRTAHYHAHKEETLPVAREKRQQSRLTSPARHLLKGAKERAKRRGLPFDLTEEYLETLWTGRCAVSRLPFEVGRRGYGPKFLSPSLDRIIPKLGYTKGNVRIVLWGVNAFKYDGSDEDMYRVAIAIVRNFRPKPSPSL